MEDYDLEITEEEAENALDALAGGILPGTEIRRELRFPLNYPFGPDQIVVRYRPDPKLCLRACKITPVSEPFDVEAPFPEIALEWASIVLTGTIPEDAEPGTHRWDQIELHHYDGECWTLEDKRDLDDLPPELVRSIQWPRDILVG
jgi:hypothetical protein